MPMKGKAYFQFVSEFTLYIGFHGHGTKVEKWVHWGSRAPITMKFGIYVFYINLYRIRWAWTESRNLGTKGSRAPNHLKIGMYILFTN